MPPAAAHSAMKNIHEPPCRLLASADVTVLNQRPVLGRLKRQAIKGEKMTRMTSVTRGQKLPVFKLLYRLMRETMPTTERSVLATTCMLRVQLRPRRTISPKNARPAAIGHATTKNNTFPSVGLTPGNLYRVGLTYKNSYDWSHKNLYSQPPVKGNSHADALWCW